MKCNIKNKYLVLAHGSSLSLTFGLIRNYLPLPLSSLKDGDKDGEWRVPYVLWLCTTLNIITISDVETAEWIYLMVMNNEAFTPVTMADVACPLLCLYCTEKLTDSLGNSVHHFNTLYKCDLGHSCTELKFLYVNV